MVRRIVLLMLALALTTTLCKKEDERPTPSTVASAQPAIVFLGDSLSAGLGLPEEETFPYAVQQQVNSNGLHYRVINAGRSGDTTAGGLSRLAWYLRPEVKLKVLIIELGSNDAMRGQQITSIEKNLTEIIHKTRAYDPTIKILMYQLYTFPNLGRAYGSQFESIFARVAKKEKIVLLPFLLKDVAGRPTLNQADGIHPNSDGAKIVSKNVWTSLKPYL